MRSKSKNLQIIEGFDFPSYVKQMRLIKLSTVFPHTQKLSIQPCYCTLYYNKKLYFGDSNDKNHTETIRTVNLQVNDLLTKNERLRTNVVI